VNERPTVLVVDDEKNILKILRIGLEAIGLAVEAFGNPVEAIESLEPGRYDIAFIDLMMAPVDGMQVLREIKKVSPSTTAVIITAHGSIDSAVEAIKQGAFDFLQKPFDLKELQLFTTKVLEHHRLEREVNRLRELVSSGEAGEEIVTRNPAMREQIQLARQVADSPLTVLIEGESGTGKELVAQFIHRNSPRRDKPLVKVNCAALPENLLESELFGHVKGAFTGAVRDREGRFEAAAGGTVFLDEVADMSKATQVKLLRFLQHREFERVGDNRTLKVDVRIIAATNRRLLEALEDGSFRDDLYYRINAVRINLPPLRSRPEDLLLLIHHFLGKFAPGRDLRILPRALDRLTAHRWPGNVRELENVMERAALLAVDGRIDIEQLPEELRAPATDQAGLVSLEEAERRHISRVLATSADLDEAARVLQIDPTTLWRKRKKYGL
jgi:NtrC-family two-component system response regulator AlgB